MSTKYKTETAESRALNRQRYWSSADSPRPWHPWGTSQLLWIVFLFLVGVFLVAPRIEADIRAQVSDRLHTAGIGSAAITADGQSVSIRADSTETTAMAIRAIASSTHCRTWAGQLSCPTTIDVKLDVPVDATMALTSRPHRCDDKFESVLGKGNIQFMTNSAAINGSEQLLKNLSRIANTCPGKLTVEGHTDDRGDTEMNKALSQARADSVLAALVGFGVEPYRLTSVGHGERFPIADNATSEGRAANRRISISTQ